MKKFLCFFFSICLILSVLAGCRKTPGDEIASPSLPDKPEVTIPSQEQGSEAGTACHPATLSSVSPIPPLEADKESDSPLGLYDNSVFGIVEKTCDHGITLTIQKKSYFFKWTDLAKKAYNHFNIKVGDEIAIPLKIEENTYIAVNVEKVM